MNQGLVWDGHSWWPKELGRVLIPIQRDGDGVGKCCPSIVPYINTTVPTHSPDGITYDVAIAKLLYPLIFASVYLFLMSLS